MKTDFVRWTLISVIIFIGLFTTATSSSSITPHGSSSAFGGTSHLTGTHKAHSHTTFSPHLTVMNICNDHNPWRSQIEMDMKLFDGKSIEDKKNMTELMWKKLNDTGGVVASVRSNVLYYRNMGRFAKDDHPGLDGLLFVLHKALSCFILPDVDIYIRASDYCESHDLPVFSWNKMLGESCILYPWVQFLWLKPLHVTTKPEWSSRKNLAVFRGVPTGGPGLCKKDEWQDQYRIRAVSFCHNHSNFCDAEFTALTQCDSAIIAELSRHFNLSKSLSWEEEMNFKYYLLLDGNGAPASRSAKAFSGGFAVLRQESVFREFFYSSLRPWVHYVPISDDLSDLEAHINVLQKNDKLAELIASNSREYAERYFTDFSISCFIGELVKSYAQDMGGHEGTSLLITDDDLHKYYKKFVNTINQSVKNYHHGQIVPHDILYATKCNKDLI